MTRHKKKKKLWLFLIPLLLMLAIAYALIKPLYETRTAITLQPLTNPRPDVTLPENGESAVTIQGYKTVLTSTNKDQSPTASTSKVITALMILNKYPLDLNQQGPMLTMTAQDVDLYNSYLAAEGSVVKVELGEQISEYQALQAILLPSSCNMSDSAAIWAFGSLAAYNTYATSILKQWNINDTVIGTDASGLSPTTTSSPSDLIKVGKLALNNPVLAQIVNQKTAIIPVQGMIKNVNILLGKNGIIGIKTGNNNEDTGAYLFASKNNIQGTNQTATIVGAVMDEPSLIEAMSSSIPIINSAISNITVIDYPATNQVVGYYSVPWSNSHYQILATQNYQHILWDKTTLKPIIKTKKINYLTKKGTVVGAISVNNHTQNLILNEKIPRPSLVWEIKNIFKF